MSRGVRGEALFRDDGDYRLFLQLMMKYQQEYGFIIHSYCLMTNHFHIQLETAHVSLSRIMEKLLKSYANNFNAKYNFVGHVFQGTYKALLIEDQVYFLETGRYIHLNPVKAGMVRNPEDYAYSSYNCYVKAETGSLVNCDKTLGFFSGSDPQEYAKFVASKINHQEYEENIMAGLKEDDKWLPW